MAATSSRLAPYAPGPDSKIEVQCDKSGARVVENAGWLLDLSSLTFYNHVVLEDTPFPLCAPGAPWLGMARGQERIRPFLKNLKQTSK